MDSSLPQRVWKLLLRRGPLELVIWALAAAGWIYLLFETKGQLLETTVWSVPFLLVIAVVSLPWRTVSWKNLLGFFLLGTGPVFLFAALAQWGLESSPIEGWTLDALDSLAEGGTDLHLLFLGEELWAPITEELLKVTPLLVFVWWRRTGLRTLAGPLDYGVLAGATGAGMAWGEDVLVFLHQGLPGPPSSNFALGLGRTYQGLVGADSSGVSPTGRSEFADNFSFLFAEMQSLFGVVWSGHGALALAVGLSIGLAVWARKRYGNRLFYLAPIVVYAWVVWEHIMANWYGGAGCNRRDLPLCTLADIDLRGRILPIVILLAWGFAIYVSHDVYRTHRNEDPALGLAKEDLDRSSYAAGPQGSVGYFRDRLDFLRWRRKVAFGTFHLQHARRVRVRQPLALLVSRTRALMIRRRLTGEPPTDLPHEAEAVMSHLTPIN